MTPECKVELALAVLNTVKRHKEKFDSYPGDRFSWKAVADEVAEPEVAEIVALICETPDNSHIRWAQHICLIHRECQAPPAPSPLQWVRTMLTRCLVPRGA